MASHTMTAAVLRQIPDDRLHIEAVPTPQVSQPDDLIVRIGACGICGTDLHIMEGESYLPELPFVLGHEPAGTVVAAGADAQQWLGKRVVITLFTGCGHCPQCRLGDERLCPDVVSDTGVFGAWGGYAEYLRIHAAQAVAVPDCLSDIQAASLVDAGATAANSVRVAMTGHPKRVLVLGAGPIGLLSAEMLRSEGVAVQLTQRSPRRRAAAAALGYDVVGSIAETDGAFSAVIDATGSPDVFNDGVRALGPRGKYILAGYAVVPNADFAEVSHKEAEIVGIRSGSRKDLTNIIELAAQGRVRLPQIVTWRLAEINEAMDAIRGRKVDGKVVIVPSQGQSSRAPRGEKQ
ncbi:MAG: alcohol dehydrogenase catalytic domain-containing protein [Propionibacteriaceae bacterium]|jgi:NAD+-dependent secondary alcohol dehydrogenase Adh1|nr:alcohol dehydrogenase catalytic domain-containing protein [Propionibacteriaceae bacterium]